MMNNYLQMLADSLEKKNQILTDLIEESNSQAEIVKAEVVDWKLFDASVEKKGELIETINQLDEGFDTLFARIKEGLEQNRAAYEVQIKKIQSLIKEVTEKSTELMATEERNKALVVSRFSIEKSKFKTQRVSSKAATSYYNSMNKMNFIDPQLMDHKK